MAASLVAGDSTGLMQPASSATRAVRAPCAACTCPAGSSWRRRFAVRRQAQHGGDARQPDRAQHRRQRAADLAGHHRQAEQRRIGEHARQQRAQHAVGERALIGLLDVLARVIDQMHVMHAGGAGRHAGQTREAAVDVLDHVARRRPLVLEHLLDQIDAPARTVELVAEQHVSRAGGGAKAAMHAGAQDLFGLRHLRIHQLREGEGGLHC